MFDARGGRRRVSTETRRALGTTEFYAYVATVVGVLIAAAIVDDEDDAGGGGDAFGADRAWLYVVILTAAYMLARGWAKSGSREPYWEDQDEGSDDRDRNVAASARREVG